MEVAADFTTGIWVIIAVKVAIVKVGTAGGIGFKGKIGVAAWAGQLPSPYIFFTLVLWLSFSSPPSWTLRFFLFRNFYCGKKCWCIVAIGVGAGVWGQACLPAPNMFSSSLLRNHTDRALCSRVT